jgi:hypothetical protein
MSQTKQLQQEAAAGSPRPRKDWELFWRIIAGLMVLVIAWVLWVLYQITPRSVVTPLAFANRTKPIGHQAATGAAAPMLAPPAVASPGPPSAAATAAAATAPPAVTSSALPPAATTAAAASDTAQATISAGAPQSSVAVQISAVRQTEQQTQGVGLRLATEITMPAAVSAPTSAKPGSVKIQEGASGGAGAAGAPGKQQP